MHMRIQSQSFNSQNRSRIFCKFTETGETYLELIGKFQNQIKTTKTHKEKEIGRGERTWKTPKGMAMADCTNLQCGARFYFSPSLSLYRSVARVRPKDPQISDYTFTAKANSRLWPIQTQDSNTNYSESVPFAIHTHTKIDSNLIFQKILKIWGIQ